MVTPACQKRYTVALLGVMVREGNLSPEKIQTGVGIDLVAGRNFFHDSCESVKYIYVHIPQCHMYFM